VLANLSDIGNFRAGSTFLNANYYAASTEIVVLFCIYKLLDPAVPRKERFFAVLLVNFAGLYLSDCRTAIAALGIALLTLLFVSKRYRAFGAAVAVLALYAVAIKILPDLFPRTEAIGEDLAVRQSIWLTAVKGIMAHPIFGMGGGSYLQISSQFGGPAVKHAHNLILDTLLNYGLAGSALLGLFLRDNLKAVRKMAGNVLDHKRYTLIVAILLSVFIHGLTDITFFSIQTGLLLAMVLAFAGICTESQSSHAYRIRKPVWIANSSPVKAKDLLHTRLDLPQTYARLENAHLMSGNDAGYRH